MRTEALIVPAVEGGPPSLTDVWGFCAWGGAAAPAWPLVARVEYADRRTEPLRVREGVCYSSGVLMRRVWLVAPGGAGDVHVDIAQHVADLVVSGRPAPAEYWERTFAWPQGEALLSPWMDRDGASELIATYVDVGGLSVGFVLWTPHPTGGADLRLVPGTISSTSNRPINFVLGRVQPTGVLGVNSAACPVPPRFRVGLTNSAAVPQSAPAGGGLLVVRGIRA